MVKVNGSRHNSPQIRGNLLRREPVQKERFFWLNNGKLLTQLGQLEAALDCFDRTLALNKTDYEAWAEKGCLLEKMGRLVEAERCFNQSLGVFAEKINLEKYDDGLSDGAEARFLIEAEGFTPPADKTIKTESKSRGIVFALGMTATLILLSTVQLYRCLEVTPAYRERMINGAAVPKTEGGQQQGQPV